MISAFFEAFYEGALPDRGQIRNRVRVGINALVGNQFRCRFNLHSRVRCGRFIIYSLPSSKISLAHWPGENERSPNDSSWEEEVGLFRRKTQTKREKQSKFGGRKVSPEMNGKNGKVETPILDNFYLVEGHRNNRGFAKIVFFKPGICVRTVFRDDNLWLANRSECLFIVLAK